MTDVNDRPLTFGERAMTRAVFGEEIDVDAVRVRRRRWFPLQPRNVVMAPCGHLHFHPRGELWSDDFSSEWIGRQGLFIHEMMHVWQAQRRGRFYLPLMRHPFCRYRYEFVPGRRFVDYGLEQQAEIVRHVFLQRNGYRPANAPTLAEIEPLLPFLPSETRGLT